MRKLHAVAFYALLAPALTLSAGSLLAQQSSAQGTQTQSQQSTQPGQSGAQQSTQPGSTQQSTQPGSTQPSSTQPGTRSADPSAAPGSQQGQTQRSTQGTQQSTQGTQQSSQRSAQPGSQPLQTTRMGGSDYLTSAPNNAVRADNIMGSDVMTIGDENVGPVNDLIFDDDGQIIAVVIGVGGFLGMGQKDVAISWDSISRSAQDRDKLRVDATREDLRAAPEFRSSDR
jgi:sporulation protein YlmC with PRC-barrel domain